MKMVMKRMLNGFNLKLKSSSDIGILGGSRQRNKAGGHAEELRGRADFDAFSCCKHGRNRPAGLVSDF